MVMKVSFLNGVDDIEIGYHVSIAFKYGDVTHEGFVVSVYTDGFEYEFDGKHFYALWGHIKSLEISKN